MNFDIEISMPSSIDLIGGEVVGKTNASMVMCATPDFELGCTVVDESTEEQRLHGFKDDHPIASYLKGLDYCDAVWLHYNPHQNASSHLADQTLSAMVYYACRILHEGQHEFDYEAKLQLLENLRKDFPNQEVAQILAQMSGGLCTINTQTFDLDEHEWPKDYRWSFINCSRTEFNHAENTNKLVSIYKQFTSVWQQKDWQASWDLLNQYQDALQCEGYVSRELVEQIAVLRTTKGVRAVKYCSHYGMCGILIVHQCQQLDEIKSLVKKDQQWLDECELAPGIQLNFGVA